MEFNENVITLYYTRIFSVPFLNVLLYRLQRVLIGKKLINFAFASAKENKHQKAFFRYLNKKYKIIISKSYKFSRSLRFFENKVILDHASFNYKNLKLPNLHRLLWSLIFTTYVTSNTKKNLNGFITKNFEVKNIVIIPTYIDLTIICDFILKTVLELGKKGYIVIIIPLQNSKWVFRSKPKHKLSATFMSEVLKKSSQIFVHYPVRLTPLRFHRYQTIASIDIFISSFILATWIRLHFEKPIIWNFDFQNYLLANFMKNKSITLYDCVDFFTSSNNKLAKIVHESERRLIKKVDYFFVNSHTLYNLKRKTKTPTSIVPQGFDLDTYQKNQTPSNYEKGELDKLKQIFKKIPKPIVGYIGNLNFRLDYDLLINTIRRLPHISFVFTKSFEQTGEDKLKTKLEENIKILISLQNVYMIPRTSSKKVVKEIIKYFDMGVIPYDVSMNFNKYSYPMKVFEYFYIGIPVVSTPIKELKRFPRFVKIGNSSKEWENIIKSLLSNAWPRNYQLKQKLLAKNNSWEKKVSDIVKVIN